MRLLTYMHLHTHALSILHAPTGRRTPNHHFYLTTCTQYNDGPVCSDDLRSARHLLTPISPPFPDCGNSRKQPVAKPEDINILMALKLNTKKFVFYLLYTVCTMISILATKCQFYKIKDIFVLYC